MSSLKDRIELLEDDLKAVPPRISVYHDLPFAILRYEPSDEWALRREVKLLATRLEQPQYGATSTSEIPDLVPPEGVTSGTVAPIVDPQENI